MNQPPQITPTLGPRKLAVVLCSAVIISGYVRLVQLQSVADHYAGPQLQEMFPAGCVYGLLASLCWISSAVNHRYGRVALRVVVVLAATMLLTQLRESRSVLQTAADLAGLAIVQSIVFLMIGVPRWQTRRSAIAGSSPRVDQFGIADLVVATTAIAILFSIAVRYSPAIKPAGYWGVLAATWIGGSIVTAMIAAAATSRRPWRAAALVSVGLMIAVGGTYAIAMLDSIIDEGRVDLDTMRGFASFYGRVVWGYLATFTWFALIAWYIPHNRHPS
jgi:hypothetical protein